jgi:hypothetical protein
VGLGECIGVVEIVGRRRATPMLVSNEINCVLIGVAPCFPAAFLK